jgi:hypothetical protein
MLLQRLQASLVDNSEQNLQDLKSQLDLVLNEFEQLDYLNKYKKVKSFLFCIEKIAKNKNINQSELDVLVAITKSLKPYTHYYDYYKTVLRRLFKQMLLLTIDTKRNILHKKILKVIVETGTIIIANLDISNFESVDGKYYEKFKDKLFIIETGGDGICLVEIEIISSTYPFLSLSDYKKEILSNSDLLLIKFKSKVFVSDGIEQELENVFEIEPGEYNCCWYELPNKYKVIMVKK